MKITRKNLENIIKEEMGKLMLEKEVLRIVILG